MIRSSRPMMARSRRLFAGADAAPRLDAWQREVIGPQRLCLVQWLVDVFGDQVCCTQVAQFWAAAAAIEWAQKCASSFIACHSIQIYRALQRSLATKFIR